VLNTATTFPVTVTGLFDTEVRTLREALDAGDPREFFSRAAPVLTSPGFRWLELEQYVDEWKTAYERALAGRSPDGLDDEDEAHEVRSEAVGMIPVRLDLDACDLAFLFEGSRDPLAIGEMLLRTYSAGLASFRRQGGPGRAAALDGWGVSSVDDDRRCPACAALQGKRFPPDSPPRLPHHIGCRCTLTDA
jgi:hypothetical protein